MFGHHYAKTFVSSEIETMYIWVDIKNQIRRETLAHETCLTMPPLIEVNVQTCVLGVSILHVLLRFSTRFRNFSDGVVLICFSFYNINIILPLLKSIFCACPWWPPWRLLNSANNASFGSLINKTALSYLFRVTFPYSCVLTTKTDVLLIPSEGKPWSFREKSIYSLPVEIPKNKF